MAVIRQVITKNNLCNHISYEKNKNKKSKYKKREDNLSIKPNSKKKLENEVKWKKTRKPERIE